MYTLRASGVLLLLGLMTACGGGSGSGTNSVSPPSLTTTTLQTAENSAVSQQLVATNPNGVPVIFSKASDPQHGAVTVSAGGTVTYTPSSYFYGTDSFSVSLSDSKGGTAAAVVSVTVSYVNYPPVAHDDQLRIASAASTISILSNDDNPNKDALTVTILTQPLGGTVAVQNGTTVTFQPVNSFVGPTGFTYRITNPSGSSSDATVQLVVGNFAGVVFLADETTLGKPELHFFDGFKTVRLSTTLQSGATIQSFKIAPDGRHVAYIVNSPQPISFPQVLVADIANPGTAQLVYSGAGSFSTSYVQIELNHDASFVLVSDSNYPSALKTVLAKTSGGALTTVGLSNPGILQVGNGTFAFNPVSNEYYIQGQVGGSPPPMSGTGSTSLFAASNAAPDPLVQIGASYGGNDGEGSGYLLGITPDGRRVLHAALTYVTAPGGGNPTTFDLLVNDRATNTETYLYRKFSASEYWIGGVDISSDGAGVCFSLNELPASGSFSAGKIWIADPRAPGAATAVTPITDYNYGCRWASDSKNIVYEGANINVPIEPWVVDTAKPGVVSRLREPLSSGDEMQYWALARKTLAAVVAVLPSGGSNTIFYRAAIDTPGVSTSFFSVAKYTPNAINMDALGTAIQFLRNEPVSGGLGSINRLHWVSTQTSNYDLTLSRPDSSTGVLQAAFVPQ